MSSLHKWEIEVSSGAYYPHLAQNFPGNDISLSYENEDHGITFFAYSWHVDELDDPTHVAQRIYSLQILLNGALRLEWGNINEKIVRFQKFARISGGKREAILAEIIEEEPFRKNTQTDKELIECNNIRSRYSAYLLCLSKTDRDLRSLLFLVGLVSKNSPIDSILTWNTLYKILDTVKYHVKALHLSLGEFVDQQKVEEFTAACNNMSILGVYARHGAAGNRPPKNFMGDLDEAINLIMSMATKFCQAYVHAKHS